MKKITVLLLFIGQIIFANNLTITNVTKTNTNSLSFDVSWDNSWLTSTYRDASWIFLKFKNSSGVWQHLDLTGATVSGFTLDTFSDKGVMISREFSGTGTVSGSVTVYFDSSGLGPFPDFKVFGIEMVYINQGAFWVGDGEDFGYNYNFHQGDNTELPYYVADSGIITVGNTASDISANGDLSIDIPATYPTGFDEFYIMKYELSQEQYVEFLNTLTAQQQQARTRSDLSAITSANRFVMVNNNYPGRRNSIACDDNATNTAPITFYCDLNNNGVPNEINDGQNVACNYLTFNDCLAYLEWAALRPLTDMEYEKAARGSAYPTPGEFANGTTLLTSVSGLMNPGRPNEIASNINTDGLSNMGNNSGSPIRVGGLANATSTRLQSGGSFFGVMELSGNITDLVVFTNDQSLTYTYTFGSGQLDPSGSSTTWNGNFTRYTSKGGGYYAVYSGTSISHRLPESDFDLTNIYTYSQFGLRGAR